MAAPLGIGDIQTIIEDAVKLYRRFDFTREQIKRMGEDMELLLPWLSSLESFLNRSLHVLKLLVPNEIRNLKTVLKEIHHAVSEVLLLFERWDHKQDLVSKFGWAFFSSKPERLTALHERIGELRTYVRDWMQLMQSQVLNNLQPGAAIPKPKEPVVRSKTVLFLDNHDNGRAVIAQCYAQLLQRRTERWFQETDVPWPLLRFIQQACAYKEKMS